MRKFSLLLLVVVLLAGCGEDLKPKYHAGDLVESVVSGMRGQVICTHCNKCSYQGADVPGYKVRFPAGPEFTVDTPFLSSTGEGKPHALVTEYLCEFELRPAQTK